jgi:hypothetical protein
VSTTPAKNLSLVSLTPAINLCHGFSVITGVVDTSEQFIAGDNDTGDNFIAGDNNPAINLLPVTRTRTPWRWGAAKVEGYKSAISPAAEVGHGRQWCHWNRHEKLHPETSHTS